MTSIEEGKQSFKMVGYLASRDDLIILNSGRLMARLYPCTDWPESMDFTRLPSQMNCIINNNFRIGFKDDESNPDAEQRKDSAFNYFKDKWLITTPNFSYNDEREKMYVNAYDVEVLPQNPDTEPSQVKFIRIPSFEAVREYNRPTNQYNFEEALLNGKVLGSVSPWLPDESEAPEGVIWSNSDIDMSFYTSIDYQEKTARGFAYFPKKNGEKIKRVSVTVNDTDWLSNLLTLQGEDVVYMPQDIVLKYEKRATSFIPQSKVESEETLSETVPQNEIKEDKSKLAINIDNDDATADSKETKGSYNSKQTKFIQHFFNQTQRMGLHYDVKDLVNFHTAMECEGLVILSGLSGTGKSKLVSAYATTLGLVDPKTVSSRLCFVPVRPFWADDSDLLGYADMVNSVYRSGDSQLVDTLLASEKDPEHLYIVVFDEMNLARVEHYFSQFLSVLELSSDSRYIQLYNPQLGSRLYNQDAYPARIRIGGNVRFVGTVNTDESTFQFSDKVLDRSNVISLHIVPFNQKFPTIPTLDNDNTVENMSTDDYMSLVDKSSSTEMTQNEKSFLWDIHCALNAKDRNLGIGWRIVQQIENFLICLPNIDGGMTRGEAFDLQLVQRVLTKVRGSEELLRDLVGTDEVDGDLVKIFDRYGVISEFTESRQMIAQKSRELNLYGFTM